MRTRDHDWFDTKKQRPLYSFQVFQRGKWRHVAEDGKPLLFDNPGDRNISRHSYRLMKPTIEVGFPVRDAYDTLNAEVARLREQSDRQSQFIAAMEEEFRTVGCSIIDGALVNVRAEKAEKALSEVVA